MQTFVNASDFENISISDEKLFWGTIIFWGRKSTTYIFSYVFFLILFSRRRAASSDGQLEVKHFYEWKIKAARLFGNNKTKPKMITT